METKPAVWVLATNADSSGTMARNITMDVDGLENSTSSNDWIPRLSINQIDQDIASYSRSCRGDVFLSTQVV